MSVEPAPGSVWAYVIDDIGVLQRVTPDYAERALKTGQITRTDKQGVFRLIPQPIAPPKKDGRTGRSVNTRRRGRR